MVKLGPDKAVKKFAQDVTLTQYSSPSAVSGFAPSKGADTTPTTIRAAVFPVVDDQLAYLFQGIIDEGEAAMMVSVRDVSTDINTGDKITYNTVDYKITKVVDWTDIGNLKVYSLKKETV